MNILTALLRRAREGKLPADPIPLDTLTKPKFQSWEKGFDAYVAGVPFDHCELRYRSRPLWKQGWRAAQRIDQLIAEQTTTGNL